jgi:alkaline phosphatase D
MRLHSTATFGQLAQFFVLDTRQHRSHQVCAQPNRGGSTVVREEECSARLDPTRTVLGTAQEQWLHESLGRSAARWNIVAQTTLMAQADRRPGPGADYWTDGWDGYPRARERLLGSLATQRVSNPLVIGGDVHMAAVTDLKLDFNAPEAPAVATEFVCPSITSHGPSIKRVELLLQENQHMKFANGALRGYTTLDLTPTRCTARIRAVASVTVENAPIRNLATYTVEHGRAGAQRA